MAKIILNSAPRCQLRNLSVTSCGVPAKKNHLSEIIIISISYYLGVRTIVEQKNITILDPENIVNFENYGLRYLKLAVINQIERVER